MAIIRLVAIFCLSLLKFNKMAITIPGWVLPLPGTTNIRDWSTFRTTFPGPGGGWIKVFAISQCCPTLDPPLVDCDVFLNRGADIVILRDFSDLGVLATGPAQYTDIAILGTKLYARRFTGALDEYTIGPSSVTLTTPSIHNIGTGTSLASDGTYLIYDVNSGVNAGKIVRSAPGGWAEEVFDLPEDVVLQGDIMLLGTDRLAMTTFKNSSSLLIIDNDPVTPTIYADVQIKDTSSNIITAVYGIFQRNNVLYILRSDGNYYSMSDMWPIIFHNEGQFTLNGITYGDWNGAAQNGDCGTVTPPEEPVGTVGFRASLDNVSNDPLLQIEDLLIQSAAGTVVSSTLVDLGTNPYFKTYFQSAASPSYQVEFTLSSGANAMIADVKKVLDGGLPISVDSTSLLPGQTFYRTYSDVVLSSFELEITFSPV